MKTRLGIAVITTGFLVAQGCMGPEASEENVANFDQGYGSCTGLRAWDGGNYLFTVAQGEVITHNGKAWQATQAITYPNAECAPGAAQAWCAGWFTDLGACGASSGSTTGGSSGSSSSLPAECFSDQMIHMMNAELAVAMAKELGEINPLRDLRVNSSTGKVELSSTGLGRCSSTSNVCERVKSVLAMQDSAVNNVINPNVFNATSFRTNLVSQWTDQQNYEAAQPGLMPAAHTLVLSGESPAYCGTDFKFNVVWGCSGGSGGTAYTMTNNQASMEAENADAKIAASNGDTFSNSGGVMIANSDSGDYWLDGSGPRMEFKVNFSSTGTHYVHALATGPHGGSDSIHIGLDGAVVHTNLATNATGALTWANSVGFNVGSTGVHTVTVYAREDGVKVDKVVVNKSSGSPSWSGESARGGSSSCDTDTSKIGNRLRCRETTALIEGAGFEVLDVEPTKLADENYLQDIMPRLRTAAGSSYRDTAIEDLRVLSGYYRLRKA